MMNETPRRSRRSTPPGQNNTLPLVPILIGVIVLGFIIGAGLSLAGKRGGGAPPVVANVAPTRAPSLAPVTPAPTDPPTPMGALVASVAPRAESPSPAAAGSKVPATHSPPTRRPALAAAVAQAPRTEAPISTALPSETPEPAKPKPMAARVASPIARQAAIPVAPAAPTSITVPTDAPASSDDADSEFGKLATAVVRQYISAIERGDDATAYAAFGPGAAGNVKLLESGILDTSTHIQHVEARGAGNNMTVNVDLKTTKGLYFGQYTVHRADSGAVLIADHALNPL